jgi:hypothetical protein
VVELTNPLIPEDKYNEVLDKNLEFLLQFEKAEVTHPLFDTLKKAMITGDGSKEDMDLIYSDPNLSTLFQCLEWIEMFDKEEKYKKSFINLMRIIILLYERMDGRAHG